jgi:hypothetical protein
VVGVAYGLVMIAQAPPAGPVAPPVTQAATSQPMWVPPQPTQPQMIVIPVPQQLDTAQKPADAQNTPAEIRFTIPESWGRYIGWGIAIVAVMALLLLGVDPGPLLKHVAP